MAGFRRSGVCGRRRPLCRVILQVAPCPAPSLILMLSVCLSVCLSVSVSLSLGLSFIFMYTLSFS